MLAFRCPVAIIEALERRAALAGHSIGTHAAAALARGLNFEGENLTGRTRPPGRPRNIIAPDGKSE